MRKKYATISAFLALALLFSSAISVFAAGTTSVGGYSFMFEEHTDFVNKVEKMLESRKFAGLLELLESDDGEKLIAGMKEAGLNKAYFDYDDRVLVFSYASDGKSNALSAVLCVGTEKDGKLYGIYNNGYTVTPAGLILGTTRYAYYINYKDGEPCGEFEEYEFRGKMSTATEDGWEDIFFDSVARGIVGEPYDVDYTFYDGTSSSSTHWSGFSFHSWDGHYLSNDRIFTVEYADVVFEKNNAFHEKWCNPADFLGNGESETIKNLSDSIVGDETNDMKKLYLINKWVAENIYYDFDLYYGKASGYYSPEGVYTYKRSVCQGYANLTLSLIRAQNIPCMPITSYALGFGTSGRYTEKDLISPSSNHETLEAWADGRWIILDPTWDSGNQYENGSYKTRPCDIRYFDARPDSFANSHMIVSRPTSTEENTPSVWAQGEVSKAMSLGLVPYESQNGYRNPITREKTVNMLVALIEKIKGVPIDQVLAEYGVSGNANPFSDTANFNVIACNALGIVSGVGGGRFDPEGLLTRAEMAAIINRTAKLFGIDISLYTHDFNDVAGHWVDKELGWVTCEKILVGVGDGRFDPNSLLTKEQAIAITYRTYEALNK